MGNFDWIVRPVTSEREVEELSRALNNLPVSLTRALWLRGVRSFDEARTFFRGGGEALHAPTLMADMEAAADRVARAVRARERVVVYGDYDVDGTTSTAMMTHFLRDHGVPAAYFIPDRFKHGYGLCESGVDAVAELGASLMIAIDCGVTAVKEVAYARGKGIDVVICDHHTPPATLPDANALLDPKRADCGYPFKELCGCGVAFKLISRVAELLGDDPDSVGQYLDLVALATAADVVPLRGENRVLLRQGIERIRAEPRLGIKYLAEEGNVNLGECNTRAIQFALGPRINAAGRLGDAKRAVKLLLAEDIPEATARARQLERVNTERKALDRLLLETAEQRAEALLEAGRSTIVLYDESWHLGVLGIVAARLVDRLQRPTVLLGGSNGLAKGSARSIDTVNVYQALAACSELLTTFGGHDYAAGLALDPSGVPAFQDAFEQAVLDMGHRGAGRKTLEIDAELPLADVDARFWAVLEQFEPFGAENDPPVFMSRHVTVASRPRLLGQSGDHLKFRARHGDSPSCEVIGFRMGDRFEEISSAMDGRRPIDMAYTISENRWNGTRSLQLQLKDLRATT
ncbi:MAG: single-stranded-DNA-specific exonuclease RecJ [Rhodothermales bacterium]|nr:single-stranded-DNA-specific exonuclease RecJ [Rhodothermales bacterium]